MNASGGPIQAALYAAMLELEKLPASAQQTKVSTMLVDVGRLAFAAESEPTREQLLAMAELSAQDEGFWYQAVDGPVGYALLLNDKFGYACADAEDIAPSEAPLVLALYRAEGWVGVVRWVAERRGSRPIPPVVERMRLIDELRADRDRLIEELRAVRAARPSAVRRFFARITSHVTDAPRDGRVA